MRRPAILTPDGYVARLLDTLEGFRPDQRDFLLSWTTAHHLLTAGPQVPMPSPEAIIAHIRSHYAEIAAKKANAPAELRKTFRVVD